MYMKDAIAEYGFDCRIRKLSPKTIDCYTKQLRYFQEYLAYAAEIERQNRRS